MWFYVYHVKCKNPDHGIMVGYLLRVEYQREKEVGMKCIQFGIVAKMSFS